LYVCILLTPIDKARVERSAAGGRSARLSQVRAYHEARRRWRVG